MPADFFKGVADAFQNALAREPACIARHHMAGQSVQMQVVGQKLAEQILPPFSHLEIARDELPDAAGEGLRVYLWDAAATGVSRPPGLPKDARSDEWSSPSQTFAYGYERRYAEYSSRVGITWLDRKEKIFYGCFDDARNFQVYDHSRPLSWLLPIWCNDVGLQCVHAGMAAWRGSGVLIAGKSGSGKTTTTLSCLLDGFDYLAEDQLAIGECDGEFQGYSLYNTARVEANHLKRFPVLEQHALREEGEKTLLRLGDLFPGQFMASAPICALLLPVVPTQNEMIHSQTVLEPASAGEALRTIAANSLMLPMGGGKRGFERLSRLAKGVPSYRLRMGSDVYDIARAIRGVLQK